MTIDLYIYHPPLSRLCCMVSLFTVPFVLHWEKKATIFFCVVVDFHLYISCLFGMKFCEYSIHVCVYVCISRANELYSFYLWLLLFFLLLLWIFLISKKGTFETWNSSIKFTRLQTTFHIHKIVYSAYQNFLLLLMLIFFKSSIHYLLHHWISNETRCLRRYWGEKKAH